MKEAVVLDITTYMSTMRETIEKRLDALIPEQQTSYNTLFQAARYSLLNGGKRLRPLLTLATVDTLTNDSLKQPLLALDCACAIEMIHTYSLIHDDLPCMDDDDLRRGKPSLHKVYGEAPAILAGDYLLTKAFEVIACAPLLIDKQKIEITACLAKNAGGDGMVSGQIMDILANHAIDLKQLETIHHYKTGALITASIEIGAIVAHATLEDTAHLRQFGNAIGLCFQIMDDILDVTKQRNSDSANNKVTYMTLLGKEKAEEIAEILLRNAKDALDKLSKKSDLLHQLMMHLIMPH